LPPALLSTKEVVGVKAHELSSAMPAALGSTRYSGKEGTAITHGLDQ